MIGLPKRSSSATKTQAPKRVVRALRSYITFKKDDFFYVLSTPHDDDQWYEVSNPMTGDRGLVPVSHFEVLESRQDRINRINRSGSNASATSGAAPLGFPRSMPTDASLYGRQSPEPSALRRPSGSQAGSAGYPPHDAMPQAALRVRTTSIQHQQYAQHQRTHSPAPGARGDQAAVVELHATALYGFDAANGNELTIAEGDDLLVVAQSTGDWLVARAVHGAAAAGLVPAAYVQLHDHATGAAVGDLHAYLARHRLRLRTALEWERHQRELRASRSSHSSASGSSDQTTAAAAAGRTASPANSAYDEEQSPTPRSSIGSILPVAGMGIQKTRTRALTASSSTSSIAERSSFRYLHRSRQVSGSSLQHIGSENFPPFRPDEVAAVEVPTFICKDGAYLFQISLRFASGDQRNVYRAYEDIICCRNQLNDAFPEATAPLKLAR
ncbi:bud emergence protein 1, partial [Coemansia nantahalensis]